MSSRNQVNRSVLITGSASGFGRELVRAYLKRGWTVVATLRRLEERRSEFQADLERAGGRLELIELDVASASDRERVAGWVDSRFPQGLDVLVNNAGYGLFGALESCSEAEIRAQFETNVYGSILLARSLLPSLRRSRGRLVQFSSVLGFTGMPLTSIYCATKHALEGWCESMRMELAPFGVQVLLVEPGGYGTRFASSVRWGSVPNPEYAELTRRYDAWKTWSFARRSENGPVVLARAVVALTERTRMPLRARFGLDSRLAYRARRWIPETLWDFVQTRFYGALLRRLPPGSR